MGNEFMEDFFDDEYVKVLLADGTTKKISKEELVANQEEQLKGKLIYQIDIDIVRCSLFLIYMMVGHKGIRKEKDKLVRDFEGSSKVDDLDTKDPTLSRFVQVGQWCFDALKKMGHIKG